MRSHLGRGPPQNHPERWGRRPPTASLCQSGGVATPLQAASPGGVSTGGIDPVESVFQGHRSDARGTAVGRTMLRRDPGRAFVATPPRCMGAMEICAGARHWACGIGLAGHDTRLNPSGMREAVREAAEERHGRRGGDLRRGARRCGSHGDPDTAGARSAGMLSRQPRMRVTVALADMMARIVWALMAHGAPAELRPRRNRHAARREGCGDGRPSPRRHALFAAGSPKQRASIGCRSRTVHAPAKPKPFTGKAEALAQPQHAVRAADHARALGMERRGWSGRLGG